jgi:hypothetical protein
MTARPESSRMKKLGPELVGAAGAAVVVDASVDTGILL